MSVATPDNSQYSRGHPYGGTNTLFREELDSDKDQSTAPAGSDDGDRFGSFQESKFEEEMIIEQPVQRHYSITELVATLGSSSGTGSLPSELERRVLDFRLAQQKRREKYGQRERIGIFGMYGHLSNVRIDLEWAEDAAWRRRNGEPYLSWSDFDAEHRKGLNNRPWFTYGLIFLCTIMLIVEFGVNGWKIAPLNVNPLIGPSPQTLVKLGARETTLIVDEGQWYRLFTPLILHAGIIHFGINMAALWFIGAAVELNHGIANSVALFLIPGVGGNILSALFLPQYISVGASGGIFGLVGGCIADISLNWKLLFIKSDENDTMTARGNLFAIFWLVLDIVVNLIVGLTPYVDNFTHLGGLVYGMCCGWSIIEPLSVEFFGVNTTTFAKVKMILVKFIGLIASLIAIIVTTIWLATYDTGSSPCSGCRYISCVPFPFWKDDKWWYCDDCNNVSADIFKENSQFYQRVELTCPNGVVETIDISTEYISDKAEIQKNLPSYCRANCADRFK